MSGTPSHDSSVDAFSCTLKYHAARDEQHYTVTFKRDSVVVSSYEADRILAAIESWADTVTILA